MVWRKEIHFALTPLL